MSSRHPGFTTVDTGTTRYHRLVTLIEYQRQRRLLLRKQTSLDTGKHAPDRSCSQLVSSRKNVQGVAEDYS